MVAAAMGKVAMVSALLREVKVPHGPGKEHWESPRGILEAIQVFVVVPHVPLLGRVPRLRVGVLPHLPANPAADLVGLGVWPGLAALAVPCGVRGARVVDLRPPTEEA